MTITPQAPDPEQENKPANKFEAFSWKPSKISKGRSIANDTTILIPVRFREGSIRDKALDAVLAHLKWSGFKSANILVDRADPDQPWSKGAGLNRLAAQVKTKYVIQLDGDLLPDWGAFFEWLTTLDNIDAPLMPWPFFGRLNKRETRLALKSKEFETRLIAKQVQRGKGAGGFFLPTAMYLQTPMDEELTGWAGEDLDFSDRVEEKQGVSFQFFDKPALHHYHENDRRINRDKLIGLAQKGRIKSAPQNVKKWGKVRVAIFAMGRSGGNLLQETLAKHPDVSMLETEPLGKPEVRKYGDPPPERITHWLESLMDGETNVHGVRILLGQPAGTQKRRMIKQMIRHGWYFITLNREDEFEWLASHHLAKLEGKYIGRPYETKATEIDPDQARRQLINRRNKLKNNRRFLERAQEDRVLPLSYEQLRDDLPGAIMQVCEFLSLSEHPDPTAPIAKQMTGDPREIITNAEAIDAVIASEAASE